MELGAGGYLNTLGGLHQMDRPRHHDDALERGRQDGRSGRGSSALRLRNVTLGHFWKTHALSVQLTESGRLCLET